MSFSLTLFALPSLTVSSMSSLGACYAATADLVLHHSTEGGMKVKSAEDCLLMISVLLL